ncbi:hypothetical protein WISP_03754 [Willisornis vidua]|uniref:Uncharacterized protein n=1 Tax=Willisornis vidua TaxID=1566151 RepID=A0ABQ9DY72_9PASS|nr:hypothetical protein WISP_03754 [Willisornis vidua]
MMDLILLSLGVTAPVASNYGNGGSWDVSSGIRGKLLDVETSRDPWSHDGFGLFMREFIPTAPMESSRVEKAPKLMESHLGPNTPWLAQPHPAMP